MSISDRFYQELFIERRVTFCPEIYKELFDEIWFQPRDYEEFLRASDPSVKTEYAKSIYYSAQVFGDIFLPDTYIRHIIKDQTVKLQNHPNSYIAQDHVIHSINLYILGIYLFFNFPMLHKGLLNTYADALPTEHAVKNFVNKWRLFALYHDIGYVFEVSVPSNGSCEEPLNFKEYLEMFDLIISRYAVRYAAKIIVLSGHLKKGTVFSAMNVVRSYTSEKWYTQNSKFIDTSTLKKELSLFDEYELLSAIDKDRQYIKYMSLFDKYLTVVYSQYGLPIAFIVREKSAVVNYYILEHSGISISLFIESNDTYLASKNYICRYYVARPFVQLAENINAEYNQYGDLVANFTDNLPVQQQNELDFTADTASLDKSLTSICAHLQELQSGVSSTDSQDKDENMLREMSNNYVKQLKEAISGDVDKFFESKRITSDNIDEMLADFFRVHQKKQCRRELAETIQINAHLESENMHGIPDDLSSFIDVTIKKWRSTFSCGTERKKTTPNAVLASNFFSIDEASESFSFFPFHSISELPHDSFEEKLCAELKQHAKQLDIDFGELCSYRPSYSMCDHGLASACLLYQASVIYYNLYNSCMHTPIYRLAWNNPFDMQCAASDCADVIFAVMLHNIYTKKDRPNGGIAYTQRFNRNPFSYMGALCDLLQKWSRPKQIQQANINLPKSHYLDNGFDFRIRNGKLCFMCSHESVSDFQNNVKVAEHYLPGISDIVAISEYPNGRQAQYL